MIKMNCWSCGEGLNIDDRYAGQKGKCRHCGADVEVPEKAESVASEIVRTTQPPQKMYQCPSCLAEIPVAAKKCSHCGDFVGRSTAAPHTPRVDVNITTKVNTSSIILGTIATILGVMALWVCWMPFLGLVSILPSGIGILLASIGIAIAIANSGKGIMMPVVGGAVCFLAIAIAVFSTVSAGLATGAALSEVSRAVQESEVQLAAEGASENLAKKAYVKHIEITNIEVNRRVRYGSREWAVSGTLRNSGNRSLDEVEITAYFLNQARSRVSETAYHPVWVSDWNLDDSTPLRPGYMREFGYFVGDDAPRNWGGLAQIAVTDIEFSD